MGHASNQLMLRTSAVVLDFFDASQICLQLGRGFCVALFLPFNIEFHLQLRTITHIEII